MYARGVGENINQQSGEKPYDHQVGSAEPNGEQKQKPNIEEPKCTIIESDLVD
ncbi:MAG: hypothetical protein Tsb0034_17010 [Ekhidna sp.]